MNKNFSIDNYSYFNKYIDDEKVTEIYELIKNIISEKKFSVFSQTCIIYDIKYFEKFIISILNKVLVNIYDTYHLNTEFKIYINKLPKKNKRKDVLQVFLSLTNSITRGSFIYFNKIFFNNNIINVKLNKGDILIFNYNIIYGGFNSVMSKPNVLLEFEVHNTNIK